MIKEELFSLPIYVIMTGISQGGDMVFTNVLTNRQLYGILYLWFLYDDIILEFMCFACCALLRLIIYRKLDIPNVFRTHESPTGDSCVFVPQIL